ncbi:acetyl esterase protein [Rutstroemia sp. NJR-2017a WRK4]|nr:acetyl esterase protein [Rutstroemia sp. NJR-2017a WRK4]
MRSFAYTLALLAGGAAAVAVPDQHSSGRWIPHFNNLVAFGDSYTDESRLSYFFAHNGSAPPPGTLLPSSNSTASGGVTWDRFVSDYSGAKLYDYAVSGAVCDNKIIYRYLAGINGPFPDVVYEVDAFVADTKYVNTSTKTNTLYTNRKSDNTVYSMWIGTNDLGNGAFLTDSSLGETTIPDYIDCIFDRFDGIYATGARYFVLMNLAPLQLSPLYGMPDAGGLNASHYWTDKPSNITEVSGKMKEYTKLSNSVFDYRVPYELLIKRRYPGASIAIFDTNTLMTDIYNNPTKFLPAPAVVDKPYILCDLSGSPCPQQPGNIEGYMWYDELHPSPGTDKVIANEFINVVKGTSKYATYW